MIHKKSTLSVITTIGYSGLGVLMVNVPDTRSRLLVLAGYVGFTILFLCTLRLMNMADEHRERLAKLQAKHDSENAQLNRQKAAWKHATSDPLNKTEYGLNYMKWLMSELELKESRKPNDNGHEN